MLKIASRQCISGALALTMLHVICVNGAQGPTDSKLSRPRMRVKLTNGPSNGHTGELRYLTKTRLGESKWVIQLESRGVIKASESEFTPVPLKENKTERGRPFDTVKRAVEEAKELEPKHDIPGSPKHKPRRQQSIDSDQEQAARTVKPEKKGVKWFFKGICRKLKGLKFTQPEGGWIETSVACRKQRLQAVPGKPYKCSKCSQRWSAYKADMVRMFICTCDGHNGLIDLRGLSPDLLKRYGVPNFRYPYVQENGNWVRKD